MAYLSKELKDIEYEEFIKSLNIRKIIKSPIPNFIPDILADGFAEIEKHENRVNEVLMNSRSYVDIRKFCKDSIDMETRKESIRNGIMGYMWGATVIISRKIPDNTVLVLSEPEHRQIAIMQIKKGQYNASEVFVKEIFDIEKNLKDTLKKLDKIKTEVYNITRTE